MNLNMFRLRITEDLGFEFWMDVPNYEGLYQVSTYGRCRSIGRNTTKGILLSTKTNQRYISWRLSKKGKTENHNAQMWVALTFLPKFDISYVEVNHINEFEKHNNRVENLEWTNRQINNNYGTRNERISVSMTNGILSKPVLQFDLKGNLINEFPSIKEIKRILGFDDGNIGKCCKGKYSQVYGYIWKYKKEVE